MTGIFDYLAWRGDLTFSQDPYNVLDAAVFSNIVYIGLQGRPVDDPFTPISLAEVAAEFFCLPDWKDRGRNQNDMELLRAAAASVRFGEAKLVHYKSEFVPEEDTQFAAETFLLDDGSMNVVFRGTDNTLVGWKEDFNMSFQQTVPSQRLALDYVQELYGRYKVPMRVCGHSKGGNLAVFATAKSNPLVQKSIRDVYNFDGPGFMEYMMEDPGYLAMISRIHTYVPQSSVIGMLMNRAEPTNIVKSGQVGIWQHDMFSWEVKRKEFVPVQEFTGDSRFIKTTIENWLMETDLEERNQMVEALFSLISSGNVERADEIFNLKNLVSYVKRYGSDESIRKVLSDQFESLMDAVRKTRKPDQPAILPEPEEKDTAKE